VAESVACQRLAGQTMVMRSLSLATFLASASLLGFFGLRNLSMPPHAPGQFPFYFYQSFVGNLDGRSCPSYPVCSLYARRAVAKHGLLLGSWFILDRLIHEADDVRLGPGIVIDGEKKLYDPLERNDFWLRKGERNEKK